MLLTILRKNIVSKKIPDEASQMRLRTQRRPFQYSQSVPFLPKSFKILKVVLEGSALLGVRASGRAKAGEVETFDRSR
jgi:hypothetical protein